MSPADVRMRGFTSRVSFAEALGVLRRRLTPLLAVEAEVSESLVGRVLAGGVSSPTDVPWFRRSAMDGYAVVAADTAGASEHDPVRLMVVGDQRAGGAAPAAIGPGQALRIMTGGAVPEGADAVVMVEYAREEGGQGDRVALQMAVPVGANVMPIGEDVSLGQEILPAGRRLRPQDVALLAAVGVTRVKVRACPRVAIIPTGDELVPAGARPTGTAVVDSNSPLLSGLCRRHGAEPHLVAIVPDDPDAIREAIRAAAACSDLVVVIGGTAAGTEDHVPAVVTELGELPVHGVAVKPASPTGLGFVPAAPGGALSVPVLLSPGSPVACMLAFDFFAGAALALMQGLAPEVPYPTIRGRLARKVASIPGRTDFVRVRLDGETVHPLMTGGASILSSTTRGDGILMIPSELEGYAEGAEVDVLAFDATTLLPPRTDA